MYVSLACALGTPVCYGVGSVLQASAAESAAPAQRVDPRLLLALVRGWRYPTGLALDSVGFVLSLAALGSLPLYLVQSVVAGFLPVTAVVAVAVLGLRLRRSDVAGLVAAVVGLALVGLAAAPSSAPLLGRGPQGAVLAVTVGLLLAAFAAGRRQGPASGWVLGGVAGLAFGAVSVAARLVSPSVTHAGLAGAVPVLARAPATYAVLLAAVVATLAYATALQRGTVVSATAALVVGETVLPAVVGYALLGDRPRPGWGVLAVLGFALAVGGSVLLCRFGEPTATAAEGDADLAETVARHQVRLSAGDLHGPVAGPSASPRTPDGVHGT